MYKEEEYEFITYSDLYQAINSLDQERYDLVLFLSNTACALSPQFLNKIYNAYDAGVQAIQLHTIVENRKGIRNRFRAIREEIKTASVEPAIHNSDCHPIYWELIWQST